MSVIEANPDTGKICNSCKKPIKVNEKVLAYGVPAENAWTGKKTFIIVCYEHESCFLKAK